MPDLFWSLLQQASSQGSRSTALNPLIWIFAVIVAGLVAVSRMPTVPGYVLVSLTIFAGAVLVASVVAYFILLFRNPDALRSEKFVLSKMAIEKSSMGDSLRGFVDTDPRQIQLGSADSQTKIP
jgi:hypothetical protein